MDTVAAVLQNPSTGRLYGLDSPMTVVSPCTQQTLTPTVTAGSYTSGYTVGGLMHFIGILSPQFCGILESITLKFKGSAQTGTFAVGVFSAFPITLFPDNTAPSIAAQDSANLLGIYSLSSLFSSLGTHTIYNLDGIAKAIAGTSRDLWAVVVCTSTPTNPASTTDMSLTLGVIQ